MNILDLVLDARDGAAVSEVARNFGLDERQARDLFSEIVPPIARGMQNNAHRKDGMQELAGALARGTHDRYLDDLSSLSNPATTEDGDHILGHVFGSKEVSRNVAKHAGSRTGIDPELIKKIMPVVAALAMGVLSKQGKSGEAAPGMPSGRQASTDGGGLGDILTSVLDMDRDGSMLDDLIGMAGKMLR